MFVTIGPSNAGFINKVLIFNLTNKNFSKQDIFFDKDVSLVFLVDKFAFGINMWNGTYYVYDFKVKDYYGPYNSYQEAICKHLFGKVDGLFYIMKGISFNEELNIYQFKFENFLYTPFTFKFAVSVKDIALKLKSTLKTNFTPFVFTFEPETDFVEGVIPNFLIRLDRIYQTDVFDEYYKNNNINALLRIDRNKVKGEYIDDKAVLFANLNPLRHMTAYIPKLMYDGYFDVVNELTDDVFFKKIFTDEKIVITNEEDIVTAMKVFEIELDVKEVLLNKINLLDFLEIVLPGNTNDILFYLLRDGSNKYILEVDFINKVMTLKDYSDFVTDWYGVMSTENGLVVTNCGDTETDKGLLISTNNKKVDIDLNTGLAFTDKTIMDIEYLENLRF